jgi:hypothetical protein
VKTTLPAVIFHVKRSHRQSWRKIYFDSECQILLA